MEWIWKKIGKPLTWKVIKYFVQEEVKRQLEQKECLEKTLNNCLSKIRETVHSEKKVNALQCFPCYLYAIPIKNFDERIIEAFDLGMQLIPFYEEHQLEKFLIEEDILGRFLETESGAVHVKVDEFIRELQPGYLRFRLICKLTEECSSIGRFKILLGQFEDMIQKGLLALQDIEEAKKFLTRTREWKDYDHVKEEAIRLENTIRRIDDFHQQFAQLACVQQDKLDGQLNTFINYTKGLDRDFISHRVLPILKSRYRKYGCVETFLKQYDRRNQGSLRRYSEHPMSFEFDDSGRKVHIEGISDKITLQGLGACLSRPLVPGQIGIIEFETDEGQKVKRKSTVVHNRCSHEKKPEESFQYYAGFRFESED